jgi:parvulin-like peptidyl-prolyl isomerase
MTKRQLSRYEREQRTRTLIFAIAGAVAVLIVGILGFGYWREFIAIADEPVARVGGTSISTRTMSQLIGYYDSLYTKQITDLQAIIAQNQQSTDEAQKKQAEAATLRLQQLQSVASQADSQALDQLIEGELLNREAAARNLELTQADRDRALVQHFDLGVEELAQQLAQTEAQAAPAPKADPTPEQVSAAKNELGRVLENGRILSDADFTRMVLEPTAIQIKIQNELAAAVPTSTEQVKARHILFETEQQAKESLALIKAGNLDFAEAAKQLSQDPGSKDNGGDLGWFPKGIMDPKFEEVAFSLEPGQMSEVVSSSFGFHIIKVDEKAQSRDVAADVLEYQRSAAYSKWLGDKRNEEGNKVVYEYNQAKAKWARDNAVKPTLQQTKS